MTHESVFVMGGFSANLGFLWTELALPEAVRSAARFGFDAIELHDPADTDPVRLRAALSETGLRAISLNTARRDAFGLAAVPGAEDLARDDIDTAVAYAAQIGAGAVHVLAGNASGSEAYGAYLRNLEYAVKRAGTAGLAVLIEPINVHDAPGYFLRTTHQALEIIGCIGSCDLKMMFDCYHVSRTEGDVLARFQACRSVIGHIQFAGVPDRGPPDTGTVDCAKLLSQIRAAGYGGSFGAEYKPRGATEDSLGWMADFSCVR